MPSLFSVGVLLNISQQSSPGYGAALFEGDAAAARRASATGPRTANASTMRSLTGSGARG